MSSTFSHLQKQNVVNEGSGNDGKKNGLCQNRINLHDTCETSVISVNRHYTTVYLGKVKTPNRKKENQPKLWQWVLVKATCFLTKNWTSLKSLNLWMGVHNLLHNTMEKTGQLHYCGYMLYLTCWVTSSGINYIKSCGTPSTHLQSNHMHTKGRI